MTEEDPMLSMLKWLCEQLMEAEVAAKINASKSERTPSVQVTDVTKKKRSEVALIYLEEKQLSGFSSKFLLLANLCIFNQETF
jgi:hypothetical protein